MNMMKKFTPEKFLCRYPLTTGALCGTIVLINGAALSTVLQHAVTSEFVDNWKTAVKQNGVVTVICTLAMIAQVVMMKDCTQCTGYVWRNAYSFSITGVIYCAIMLAMHGWAIWGIKKKKASVLLSWVVVTTMWLAQTLFLLIILITIHSSDVNIILWLISFILGLVSIGILIYFILVMFGLWLQLKSEGRNRNVTTADT